VVKRVGVPQKISVVGLIQNPSLTLGYKSKRKRKKTNFLLQTGILFYQVYIIHAATSLTTI